MFLLYCFVYIKNPFKNFERILRIAYEYRMKIIVSEFVALIFFIGINLIN